MRVPELGRYVPGAALRWPGDALAAVPLHRQVDGTLVFVDVSGFTALSERLAQRGKVGAEQLTDVLNAVFGTMLGLAAARGGTLLKFGGDALFLLFTGPDHAVQAACATVEMRSALAATAKTPGPAGRLRLRMSVGVHSGAVDLFLVGTSHRELVIVGPATTAVASMEAAASAGQILIGPQTAATLPPGAVGDPLGPGYLLRWRRAHTEPVDTGVRTLGDRDVSRFVPNALRELLSAGSPESEHRTVGVSFVRYTGIDVLLEQQGHQATADALHLLVSAVQECAYAEGITFLATDLAEDGGKVILVAGFPTTADDDQGRLLRASRHVVTHSLAEGWPIDVRAGLNRGHVFAGAIGSPDRATVTVMGDTVNLAARVMAKADPGQVLATPTTLDNAQTLFATEPVEPFMVKGKSRPVTAYQVGEETGTRPPRGLGTLPFLGRDGELATLTQAIADLSAGRGRTLALLGDAGMGKTRLLREALRATDAVRATVMEARAEPYGAATPYRPVRDPLRRLLGLSVAQKDGLAQTLVLAVNRLAPDLLPWLPLVGDVLGIPLDPTDTTRDLDPKFRPDRTADAVVDLIHAVVDGPLIIAFDDSHYSDEATASLAARVERETTTNPWLVVNAARDVAEGYRPTSGEVIQVEPLDDETLRQLVAQGAAAAPLRPHEVDVVVRRVGGNPLFLEETLRNLREHGDIDSLPESLEGMVAAQIDALPPLARRVVRRASILGRSFRSAVLNDLFDAGDGAMDEATRKELADILEQDGDGRLRFRHALLRDAAYDSLPYQQRRQLHQRAAESTLRRARNRPEDYADSLALHYSMGGDYRSTWRWSRQAADQARKAFANPEAAAQYQRALDAARRLPDIDRGEVLDTWRALGDVWRQAGRFEESLQAYQQALRVAEDSAQRVALITSMARARERAGHYSAAHRDLTRAQRLAAGSSVTEGIGAMAAVASIRATVLLAQNRFDAARAQARDAVEYARSAGDDEALARSLNALATAELMLGGTESEIHLREALRIHEQRGDLADQSAITGNLGAMAWFEGRWDEARDLYEASAEAAQRAGDVVPAALAQANLGELLVAQGRLDEATTVLGQALTTLRAVGYSEGAIFAESQLGRAAAIRGDAEQARQVMTRLITEVGGTTPTDAVDLATAFAEAEVDAGDAAHGLHILESALSAAAGDAGVYTAAAERVRGRALARLGRFDESRAAIDTAVAEARAGGLGYELALLLVASQELAQLSGGTADEALIDRAVGELASLGVTSERIDTIVAKVLEPSGCR